MLRLLSLTNFKCFVEQRIPLNGLTLLTGLNSGGKSTIIQALVLLNQAISVNPGSLSVVVDGPKLSLGTAGDLVNLASGGREFGIGLVAGDLTVRWTMSISNRFSLYVLLEQLALSSTDGPIKVIDISKDPLINLLPNRADTWALGETLQSMCYISAERYGPGETYVLGADKDVGSRGEFAPSVLRQLEDNPVLHGLRISDTAPLLQRQTQAWMRVLFPGVTIEILPVERANLMTLGIRSSESTEIQRPQNVGYGITHVLPIITACLVAAPGEVLLIENPEVHLHPAAQSRIGEFLGRVAGCGVQLIVETHSDHVINGVRRAVRGKLVKPDDVTVNFFSPPSSAPDAPAQVTTVTVDGDGKLDSWPEGFFDQIDHDLAFLSGWE